MKADHSRDFHGLTLVGGGLFHKLTSILHKKNDSLTGSPRLAIGLALITWLPLCILTLITGISDSADSSISFFEDFFVHVRFLLVLPFLILVEKTVDTTLTKYIQNTIHLVPEEEEEKYLHHVNRIHKFVKSPLPEVLVLIVVYALIILHWRDLSKIDSDRIYLTSSEGSLKAAGYYYLLVCIPLLKVIIFRWIWCWIIWVYSIFRISKLNLLLDPLNADQRAGLQYLNFSPLAFSMILLAPSTLMSCYIGVEIIHNGAVLSDFIIQILTYIIVTSIILYVPLLFFVKQLAGAKRYGIQYFGNLVRKHNLDYTEKWIKGSPPKDESLLGSVDNSSLSDINGSFGPIQSMKSSPIDLKSLVGSIALNILPFIPLIFTYYSVAELFNMIIKSVMGP